MSGGNLIMELNFEVTKEDYIDYNIYSMDSFFSKMD
jgi:hypothetical protein